MGLFDDDGWGSLFVTNGSIRIGTENTTYTVAMAHQLHCLDIIRVAYATDARSGGWDEHVEHCLRYLAVCIQCAADSALEEDMWGTLSGEKLHAPQTWGVQHRCRDRKALERYMIKYEAILDL